MAINQCRWARPHGSDGVLNCCLDAGHESEAFHADHTQCAIGDRPSFYPPPTDEQAARETWLPEWFWRSVIDQDRRRTAEFFKRRRLALAAQRPTPTRKPRKARR
jgi:hypothetical protein